MQQVLDGDFILIFMKISLYTVGFSKLAHSLYSIGCSLDSPSPSPLLLSLLCLPSFFGVGGRPALSPALLCRAGGRSGEWGMLAMDEVGVGGVWIMAPWSRWKDGGREERLTNHRGDNTALRMSNIVLSLQSHGWLGRSVKLMAIHTSQK